MLKIKFKVFKLKYFLFVFLILFQEYSNAYYINSIGKRMYDRMKHNSEKFDESINYRLPNISEPSHYDIELTTNIHIGKKSFQGKVSIDIRFMEDTQDIVMHASNFTNFHFRIVNINLINNETYKEDILVYSYDIKRNFLILKRSNPLPFRKNSQWKLIIQYTGQLRTDNKGFFVSSYEDDKGVKHFLAATHFESTNARYAFPCFDEPSKRSTFTVIIRHNPAYHAISNMPIKSITTINISDFQYTETEFEPTLSMPTYLVDFIISDFNWSEGILNNLPQRIYSRSGTEYQHEWAHISGMQIIQRLIEYFDVNFELPKIFQTAIPDFNSGGMENWGLLTYREEFLLYDPSISNIVTQTNIAHVIAHEYVHQWFGNLVGIEWWSYLWLKEGLATLFSYKAIDNVYPEWDIWQKFHIDEYQTALLFDDSALSRPLTYYVEQPNEISQLYDEISYSKASAVLDMWNQALPYEVFKTAMHNFLNANRLHAVDENFLFSAIQNAAKECNVILPATIKVMLSSWTQQKGYPLLTVIRNYDKGEFSISQQNFCNENNTDDNLWYVPFNYATKTNQNFSNTTASHYLLGKRKIQIKQSNISQDEWLILNKQSTGFYRINYDEKNWKLIIRNLHEDFYKIPIRNRAQLLNDAYHLTITKHLAYDIFMEILTYISNEDHFAPWATAHSILITFQKYFQEDNMYEEFKSFVRKLISTIYNKLGINDNTGEQHYQKYTRNLVIELACSVSLTNCLKDSNYKMLSLINDNTPINPNLIGAIYCNSLRNANDVIFDYILTELLKTTDQTIQQLLITALGCSQDKSHLEQFLTNIINNKSNNKLRPHERMTILSAAFTQGTNGLEVAMNFLNDNWQQYAMLNVDINGINPLEADVRLMSTYVINEKQKNNLLNLVDQVKNSGYITSDMEQIVRDNIETNMKWLRTHRDPIMSWIQKFNKELQNSSGIKTFSSFLIPGICLIFPTIIVQLIYVNL